MRKDRRNICILMTILQRIMDNFGRKTESKKMYPTRPIEQDDTNKKGTTVNVDPAVSIYCPLRAQVSRG